MFTKLGHRNYRPNTYQARSVNRQKEIPSEKYAFPFLRPTNEALRLNCGYPRQPRDGFGAG
jgi:hypothetical protein